MSITAWEIEGKSFKDGDYGYVNIATTWKGKAEPSKPNGGVTEAMWSHESLYGVVGSKVGDFIEIYGVNASWQEGVFTHRNIAEKLMNLFSGLRMNEILWKENALGHKLNNGKIRTKKARWLPQREVDIVHLFSDTYVDVRNPQLVVTDFFTAVRDGQLWFMCTYHAREKLEEMNFENLKIVERTIQGS